MTLQGYASNFNDQDLVSSNIRDGVDIFGVEGDFEGAIPVSSVPGFVINETLSTDVSGNYTRIGGHASFEYGGEIYSLISESNGSDVREVYKLNLTTKVVSFVNTGDDIGIQYGASSVYKDGDNIYINFYNSSLGQYQHIYRDYVNNVVYSVAVNGQHTTGTLLTTYAEVSGLKYTVAIFDYPGISPKRGYMGFKIYS